MTSQLNNSSNTPSLASLPIEMQCTIFQELFNYPQALKNIADTNSSVSSVVLQSLKNKLSLYRKITDQELQFYSELFQKTFPRCESYNFPKDLLQLRKIDFAVNDNYDEPIIQKILTNVPKSVTSISFPHSTQIKDFSILDSFTNLSKLSIALTEPASIESIVKKHSNTLSSLSLFNSPITDETINMILPLKNQLIKLDLSGEHTKLSQKGINRLNAFSNLLSLQIAQSNVYPFLDISILLKNLKKLFVLDISFNTLTSRALFQELDFSRLKKLNITCLKIIEQTSGKERYISSRDIKILNNKFPKVKFECVCPQN